MIILPAIDLFGGKCVRLLKGDYDKMTVYNDRPEEVAEAFLRAGAEYIHIVDLEGAKSGTAPNIEVIKNIVSTCGLRAEVGGGIRSIQTIETYIKSGVSRVILGTAAVEQKGFVTEAVNLFGDKIAVGADIRDGYVATHGWTEKSALKYTDFCRDMEKAGVKTLICTDISRDGAMQGTNRALYSELCRDFTFDIVASGGVSTLDDVRALAESGVYGAIIGKAYYTGAIKIEDAVKIAAEVEK